MAVSFNKGNKKKNFSKSRPSRHSGCLSKHIKFTGDTILEVLISEPHKVSKDKRVLTFVQKRMGTHIRTKRKQKEISHVLAATRKSSSRATDGPAPSSIKFYAAWRWVRREAIMKQEFVNLLLLVSLPVD